MCTDPYSTSLDVEPKNMRLPTEGMRIFQIATMISYVPRGIFVSEIDSMTICVSNQGHRMQ